VDIPGKHLWLRTARSGDSLSEAIRQEERAGLAYIFWARLIVLAILAGWALTLPIERSGFYLLALAAFALLGTPPYLLARRGIGGIPLIAAFLLFDAALLSYLLIFPTPYAVDGWPPQLTLRLWNFLLLGVFLVGMALTYSPALVIWTGIATVTTWSAGYLWIASLPDTLARTSSEALASNLGPEAVIDEFLDPRVVSLTALQYQIVFLVLVTIILTLTVWRSRRLVARQVATEAQRGALSRYFSPNIVRELSTSGAELDRPTKQPVAVLFADMVGFTATSERLSPEALVELLRAFHGRLAGAVFAHDGTVDKYIGDAIMAHFGTPRPQHDDPVRALACAAAMIAEIGRWNALRAMTGDEPIGIGIGLHYGEVLVGNIGDARRLEYTVLGDTVNVANRLERLTRETGASLVVSDDLVRAVKSCGVEPSTLIDDLHPEQTRIVRGRREPIRIWCAATRDQ
jgi:adenylate cyclase